jgi:hypothetical protein
MITTALITFSLLQAAIPVASTSLATEEYSSVWALFLGPARPMLAVGSVGATPEMIPLRKSVLWVDGRGCLGPSVGWAGLCRHIPVHSSSDLVLTPASDFRLGDPIALPSRGYGLAKILCYGGACTWRWWGYDFHNGYNVYDGYAYGTDYWAYLVQQQQAREFNETSAGLRRGKELVAQGVVEVGSQGVGHTGGGSQNSVSASSGYSGSGNFGGGARSTAHAGGDFSGPASGGGSGRSGGGGKPGRD